jgi:hypothetical protein
MVLNRSVLELTAGWRAQPVGQVRVAGGELRDHTDTLRLESARRHHPHEIPIPKSAIQHAQAETTASAPP